MVESAAKGREQGHRGCGEAKQMDVHDTKTRNTAEQNAESRKTGRSTPAAPDNALDATSDVTDERQFARLVRASRTIRRFDESRRLSVDDLRALVDVARFAPTANNLQRLRFHLACEEDEVLRCFSHHKWAALLADWGGPAAGERPVAYIAVCAPAGSAASAIPNIDAGIAAQTIMLAARARGLGGCMVKSYDDGLNDDLGLRSQGLECLVLLALGYPAEKVVLEEAGASVPVATASSATKASATAASATEKIDVRYWRDEDDVHHVPKLPLDQLIV
jgi:nitroreductase